MINKEDHRIGDKWRIRGDEGHPYDGTTVGIDYTGPNIHWINTTLHWEYNSTNHYMFHDRSFTNGLYYIVKHGKGSKLKLPKQIKSWSLKCQSK